MKVYRQILFIFILFFSFPFAIEAAMQEQKYTLSIACMFHDEADYLKEWIEYHRLVGVQHFYLYNNNSSDHYSEVLAPYIESGIVDLTNWPSPPDILYTSYQKDAYNHCVKNHKNDSFWIAFIDTDEFIVPVKNATITEFLKDYRSYGGIYLNWQCYGTSHLPCIPEGKLLTESLTLKYPRDHSKNEIIKTIAQPKKIKEYFIHNCSFKKGYYGVSPSFNKGIQKRPEIDKIRINHYWTRAEDFFFNVKIPRIESYTKKPMPQETIDKILIESNSEEDFIMFPYVDDLRKAMNYE